MGKLDLQESQWDRSSPRDARLKTQEKPMDVSIQSRAGEKEVLAPETQGRSFLLLLFFVLFRSSIDWMRPTHAGEGSVLASLSGFRW